MAIKKVKLNYRSAFTKTKPVSTVPINGEEVEKLDRVIVVKCKQNMQDRIAAEMNFVNHVVKKENNKCLVKRMKQN